MISYAEHYPLMISIGIIFAAILLAWLFRRFFNRFILRSTLVMRNDPTNYVFLKHAISSLIIIVGFGMAIYNVDSLRAVANSLLAGAGILAVAVGFASQHALSNIISGAFLIIFKPYRINDRVTVKDTMQGVVEDITLRHTVIRDWQNRRIVIPNSVISEEVVVNADLTEEKICRFLEIGISYDSDIQKAKAIMKDEVLRHPLHLDVRTPEQVEAGEEEVTVRVLSLGEYSVLLRVWVWAKDQSDGFVMNCDLLESIKERFDKEGVEIPFPYRTLVMKEKQVPAHPSAPSAEDEN